MSDGVTEVRSGNVTKYLDDKGDMIGVCDSRQCRQFPTPVKVVKAEPAYPAPTAAQEQAYAFGNTSGLYGCAEGDTKPSPFTNNFEDGGVNITPDVSGDASPQAANQTVSETWLEFSGDRQTDTAVSLPVSFYITGVDQTEKLEIVVESDPQQYDTALPCVTGMIKTLTPDMAEDAKDPANRLPVLLTGYTITDNLHPENSYSVPVDFQPVEIGANCLDAQGSSVGSDGTQTRIVLDPQFHSGLDRSEQLGIDQVLPAFQPSMILTQFLVD